MPEASPPSYPELDSRSAHDKLEEFRIVDVRQPQEFGGPLGHIHAAELVPLGTLEEHADKLVGDRPLLLVCRSGARSGLACELLQKRGASVANLAGGMIAWNRAGFAIEREHPASIEDLVATVVGWLSQIAARHLEDHESDIARFRKDSGASDKKPCVADTARALDQIAAKLSALNDNAPPDLDLSLAAFRSDLAALRP